MVKLSSDVKAAIIGALIGAIIAGVITFMVTCYFTNQQTLNEKRGTIQQLLTDISALDITLQFYKQAYVQNLDLAKKGTVWPDDLLQINPNVPTLLIVDDVSNTATAPYIIKMDNGRYEETKLNNEGLARLRLPYKGGTPAVYPIQLADPENSFYCTLSYPIMPPQLYNEHGMYYVYGPRLGGLSENLSADLYAFYYLIEQAEYNRQYVQNYIDSNPDSFLTGQYFNAYMEMRDDIIRASQLSDIIVGELNEEKNRS